MARLAPLRPSPSPPARRPTRSPATQPQNRTDRFSQPLQNGPDLSGPFFFQACDPGRIESSSRTRFNTAARYAVTLKSNIDPDAGSINDQRNARKIPSPNTHPRINGPRIET